MEYEKEMIPIRQAAKRIGMRPEYLRRQILKKQTPFRSWFIKTPSGSIRYFIPRKPFDAWLTGENVCSDLINDDAG